MAETYASREVDCRQHKFVLGRCWFAIREIAGLVFVAGKQWLNLLSVAFAQARSPMPRGLKLSFFEELRPAARRLAADPGFTLVAVITVALGLGATTTIFCVVNGVLFRPLPYTESERLVRVQHTAPGAGFPALNISQGTYAHYREANRVFASMGLYRRRGFNLTGMGEPERIIATEATAGLFEALRVGPMMGRGFLESDETPGATPVVLLSNGLWHRRFGGSEAVIGQMIELDDVTHQIVGVMPPSFHYPSRETQMWIALEIDPHDTQFQLSGFHSIARLEASADPEIARANLDAVVPAMKAKFPGLTDELLENIGLATLVTPLRDNIVEDIRPTLWLIFGAVGFVLLIACANVANLFLVRAEGKQREVALRAALGASPSRILQYLLAEGMLLTILAAITGLALTYGALRVVAVYGDSNIPRLDEVRIDGAALLFSGAIAFGAGLIFGLITHLRIAATQRTQFLRDGSRGTTAGAPRVRTRHALAVAQMALALILLVGSGLLVRSFVKLHRIDPGFDPQGVLTLRIALPENRYPEQADAAATLQRLSDEIRSLPGVRAVGVADCLPLQGCTNANTMEVEELPLAPNQLPPRMAMSTAGPGYFRAMGIPLVAGRTFERRDHDERTGAMVVSHAVAERFWPGGDAIGKRIYPGLRGDAPWYTIVGVVGSIRQDDLSDEPAEVMYLPMVGIDERNYSETHNMVVVVRTDADPLMLAEPVRQAITSVDSELPVANVQPMQDVLIRSLVGREFTMLLLSVAAVVALFLGALGLYGTISYLVDQRTGEIGLHMALGARAGDVLTMVIRRGAGLACMGWAIGILGALGLNQILQALLFDVSPTDPLVYGGVSCILLSVALLATYLPARRASRIDPIEALRSE
jgi:predicted permease